MSKFRLLSAAMVAAFGPKPPSIKAPPSIFLSALPSPDISPHPNGASY